MEANQRGAGPLSPVKWIPQPTQQLMAQRSPFVGIVAKLGTPITNVPSPRMTSELNLIATNDVLTEFQPQRALSNLNPNG